jgi:hypothetical protein
MKRENRERKKKCNRRNFLRDVMKSVVASVSYTSYKKSEEEVKKHSGNMQD